MATFPALRPSTRAFDSGEYPHTSFIAMSGKQSRVRHSSVVIGSKLEISFGVIDEADMISIVSHYRGQKGGWLPFALPDIIWSGSEPAADFSPQNYAWRYLEPPRVEDLMCGGHYVQVRLESVPGEGVTALGADLVMALAIATTGAAASNGVALGMALTLEVGAAVAPGFTDEMSLSLSAGSASGGVSVFVESAFFEMRLSLLTGPAFGPLSFQKTITMSLAAGLGFTSTDPSFEQVEFLLHGWDGFTDASLRQRVISKGSAVTTSSEARFGAASIQFARAANYWMEIPQIALASEYTVECLVYLNSLPPDISSTVQRFIIVGGTNAGLFNTIQLGSSSLFNNEILVNVQYQSGVGGRQLNSSFGHIQVGRWHHIRYVHLAGISRILIDGIIRATSSFANATATFNLNRIGSNGQSGGTNNNLDGLIQGLRATSAARSIAESPLPTLPTQSWPDTTNRLMAAAPGTAQTMNLALAPGAASSS